MDLKRGKTCKAKQNQREHFASLWQRPILFLVFFYVLMIRAVEMCDTPNAMVQFASENTKKKLWRLKFRSSLALFAVKFFGFRTQREGGERGIGSSSPWFRAEVFLSSHSELGRRGTQLIQSSTCHINNRKSLLCRSFIQRSEVSFWPPGTLLRGWCKTRDEITKHRDCPYCSFCFEWNLAMLRSSELTSLRSEISCLPQKTSVAQAYDGSGFHGMPQQIIITPHPKGCTTGAQGSVPASTTTSLFQSVFSQKSKVFPDTPK